MHKIGDDIEAARARIIRVKVKAIGTCAASEGIGAVIAFEAIVACACIEYIIAVVAIEAVCAAEATKCRRCMMPRVSAHEAREPAKVRRRGGQCEPIG